MGTKICAPKICAKMGAKICAPKMGAKICAPKICAKNRFEHSICLEDGSKQKKQKQSAPNLRKTPAPTFRRVHWQVLESTFLSGKIVQKNCGFLPCISNADRSAVFRGVHPYLHGRAPSSVPNKDDKVETQSCSPW